ncbi:MAG: DUF1501 domain-containing protein [Planctomycetota bacterium]|jgi:hypothetical protein|nr:MAG: DUF1501 domain-containing protein [Planctomycetota bacterium]
MSRRLTHHCGRFRPATLSRRALLRDAACGFGAVAAAALLHRESARAAHAALPALHHPARATSVIFLYMDGGVSQVDSFDPKPQLARDAGKNPRSLFKVDATQFNNVGSVLPSPWKFREYGQSGIPVSELFPHVGSVVDELAVVRSMTSEFPEHTNANYFLHTGSGLQGRPSMGAWTTYGLGSENSDLPGFMVINGGLIPPGGLDNFTNGFLPATFQGSVIKPTPNGLANVSRREKSAELQMAKLALAQRLDRDFLARMADEAPAPDALESAIANQELAWRMQAEVPELLDLSGETAATKRAYGFEAGHGQTRTFAAECLLARRMVERGVRFVELTCPAGNGDRWDQHQNLRDGHWKNALSVDQPIAALIRDLKDRGMLDSTLVVWSGEFGRTPFAQGSDGRDHNPQAFTLWMAGGGVKGGTIVGATDDYGYRVVEKAFTIHDLHATMLHILGLDHTRLTYRFSGRDIRLTDVYGNVIRDVLA